MTRTEGGHSTDRDYFKLQFHAHNLELGFISTIPWYVNTSVHVIVYKFIFRTKTDENTIPNPYTQS